ncbi:hypothetical protein KY290_020820 [Solanum tuberosum]|uniref:Retrovirus-related Pol polyprotein from transposon TNT 1-94-like beta-barrel domain-containing protein n=1 Tax=Solanum tuberosum TaxID=4113 RepID=A0ABQ7V1R5_SOLTU|nr:hypothetical protein KY290_020820 [Solanum tuberosum]
MAIQIGGKTIEKERVSQLIPIEHQKLNVLNPPPISGLSEEQYNQLMSLLSLNNSKGIDSMANYAGKAVTFPAANYKWILDSGASDHMTCQKNFLSNERKLLFDSNITIPDGSSVTANTCGDVALNSSITLNHSAKPTEYLWIVLTPASVIPLMQILVRVSIVSID